MTSLPPEPTSPGARGPGAHEGSDADPIPGDRPPTGTRRLERAPGERYAPRSAPEPVEPGGTPSMAVVLGGAAAVLGAVAITLLVALLAIDVGLLAVAGLIGLLVAAGVGRGAGTSLPRARRRRLSVALAVAGVVLGLAGTWVYGVLSGSPLGPLDYVGQVFGLVAVALPVVAAVAAWLGSR